MRSSLRSFSHRPLVTGSVVHFGIGLLLVALTLLLLTRVAHAQAPIGPSQGSHVPQAPRSDQTPPGVQPAPVTDVPPAAPARPVPPPAPVQQAPVFQPT